MTNEVEFGNITVAIVNTKKKKKTMCLYEFIRDIILAHEPNSDDEFEVLDQIHDNLFPQPW